MITKKTDNPIVFDTTFKQKNQVIQIYVEKLKTNCDVFDHLEFIFTVNGSTHKSLIDFSLVDLYQILKHIQKSIETLVVNISNKVRQGTTVKLEFETDGKDNDEKSYKNNCYQYYIKRLAEKCSIQYNVDCLYYKYQYNHFLTFNKKVV